MAQKLQNSPFGEICRCQALSYPRQKIFFLFSYYFFYLSLFLFLCFITVQRFFGQFFLALFLFFPSSLGMTSKYLWTVKSKCFISSFFFYLFFFSGAGEFLHPKTDSCQRYSFDIWWGSVWLLGPSLAHMWSFWEVVSCCLSWWSMVTFTC